MYGRALVIVLDSVGIGELPDAARYGDAGSATLQNTARAVGGLRLPVLGALGLGNIVEVEGVEAAREPRAAFGRMAQVSAGKDSTTGHWELMGVHLERPFPTYPNGFPDELIEAFERTAGTRTLGNVAASGTEIIARLGEEHMRSGWPIVYTSADSVFQIAAHEEVVPPERLYEMCRIARRLLVGEHAVSRVIARPFVGAPGDFTRTDRRRDFSLEPTALTVLDAIRSAGLEVCAVGKIEDLFAGRGITRSVHTQDDLDGVAQTIAEMGRVGRGLIFTNLVDLDTLYGHRNDPRGYAAHLEQIDAALAGILDALRESDMLMLTADHGNDPTTPSTDHSREYVPLLVCGPGVRAGVNLGTRETFSDVGATVAAALGVRWPRAGTSFLSEVTVAVAGGCT